MSRKGNPLAAPRPPMKNLSANRGHPREHPFVLLSAGARTEIARSFTAGAKFSVAGSRFKPTKEGNFVGARTSATVSRQNCPRWGWLRRDKPTPIGRALLQTGPAASNPGLGALGFPNHGGCRLWPSRSAGETLEPAVERRTNPTSWRSC